VESDRDGVQLGGYSGRRGENEWKPLPQRGRAGLQKKYNCTFGYMKRLKKGRLKVKKFFQEGLKEMGLQGRSPKDCWEN